jgi:hypothetical protein
MHIELPRRLPKHQQPADFDTEVATPRTKASVAVQHPKEHSEVAAMQITQGSSHTIAESLKVAMVFGLLAGVTSAATLHTEYQTYLLEQDSRNRSQVLRTVGQRRKTMKLTAKANHELPLKKAKEKANELASDYGMSIKWIDETTGRGTLEYSGFTVPGEIQMKEDSVLLIVEVPKAAFFFQKKIKNELENKLFQVLNS